MKDRTTSTLAMLEWIGLALCIALGALSLWQHRWLLAAWQMITLTWISIARMNRESAGYWRSEYYRERNRNSIH